MKQNRIILLSLTLLVTGLPAIPLNAQENPWIRRRVVSPEVHADNSVTFRIYAPEVTDVKVSGGWMNGWGASESMVKNDTGLWTLTTGPLAPEIYTYSFAVDGIRMLDPANTQVMRDGARHESMLLVPGERSDLYTVNDVPHGTLSKVWYDSPKLGMKRRMYVYTPPGYEDSKSGYPVLYLLHGGGGDEDAWSTLGRTCQIMDNLVAEGRSNPMIVVMTNGNPGEAAAPGETPARKDSPADNMFSMGMGLFEESLVTDVIPWVESHYRTLEGKANRAVAGLSMGGMQTMNLAFDYPETFDYYGVMSMGIVDRDPSGREWFRDVDSRMDKTRKEGYRLYWIGCGTDDFLFQAAGNLVSKLEEKGMEYTYRESTGGHTWSNWRIYLSELAPLLFRE
jgi:enterochelin esterase-like enzyme